MIVSIKVKTIAIGLALVLAAIGLCSFLAISASGAKLTNGKTVVLDAGHGGRDGGVSGKQSGVKESDINLAVTKALKGFLEEKGYNVILTRKNTDGLYNPFAKSKKLSDMEKRKEIINNAKPDMVISIHQNVFPSSSVRGPQVFYAPGSENGITIAQTFQNVLNTSLGAKRVPMKGDYYILQCSSYPSVLVECGFLSNPEEEQLLISAEYQQKVAYAIFTAIHTLLDDGDLPYYI